MNGPCITCKWSRFEMTSHKPPRVKRMLVGACEWPVPEAVQPLANSIKVTFNRIHIWPDYTNCPVWEGKDE